MSLIYITGNSGAGKSTVRAALESRGFDAYDTDENNLSVWQRKTTGELIDRPDPTDLDAWEWNMSRSKVEELAQQAKDKPVFLCGSTSNDRTMQDLFEKVIYLAIDPETLRHRLATRIDNDFGKDPNELEAILGWHEWSETEYRRLGAIVIDATTPVDVVVDEIINNTL